MAIPSNTRRVVFVLKHVAHYQVSFFNRLRTRLLAEGVELDLIHGIPTPAEAAKRDAATVPWATRVDNHVMRIGSRELIWQSVLRRLSGVDLVIVEDAAKFLPNYVLIPWQYAGGPRVALWGHGRNLRQHKASPTGEFLKRLVTRHAHWWFAYTEGTARIVAGLSFPTDRITVTNNTLDVEAIYETRASISATDLHIAKKEIGIVGSHVAVYCGALYEEKRLPFLVESADEIRHRLPDFELLIIGAGREENFVRAKSHSRSWLHFLGARFGKEKQTLLMIGDLMLIPGTVGLAVIDSFALEIPLVTTDVPGHGPEIEYILSNYNGVKLPHPSSPLGFANATVALLTDPDRLAQLRDGCRESASTLTMGNMVERVSDGILRAMDWKR